MTTWEPDVLAVAYDDALLDWQLGDGHPTDPVRARLAVESLLAADPTVAVEPITAEAEAELVHVHDADYVRRVLVDGGCPEWSGVRPDLGRTAAHMFAGTVQLVRAVEAGQVHVGFSPQGAKHHAQRDRSGGFCVFNDMAWAALHLAGTGRRVLYVDLDAHHGDGVEALTRHEPLVRTCSVHDGSIWPGTGLVSEPEHGVVNVPLPARSGDAALLAALDQVLAGADAWRPDVLLVAVGADGHETDPLSTLQYTLHGYEEAARRLGDFAGRRDVPVIMGGAGGYQPRTMTPLIWSRFVLALDRAHRASTRRLTSCR